MTDNKLADALHVLLRACDDSDSAMYGTLGVSFVRDVAQAALAEHDAKPPANGEAELPPLPRRWYVGALNDGKFIVDTPPSPCGTDIPPDWGTPPELVLNVVALSLEQAREICDAHNAAIAALRQTVPDAVRELPEKWDRDAKGCLRDGYTDAAVVKSDCAMALRSALATQQKSRND